VLVATLGFVLAAAVPAFAAGPPAHGLDKKYVDVKLLAFNDFHGNIEAGPAGTIQTGCCTTTGAAIATPAGGIEYFSTWMKQLGSEEPNTIVTSSGDLIGASPILSGLFHDEPTINAMNLVGVDVAGVGNHEFDEGKAELLRMQNGGCIAETPFSCPDGVPFVGSLFQYLSANVIDTDTQNPLLPAYKIVTVGGEKIAFVGETLQGTPLIVTPSGVAGLDFLDEADTVNRLVPRLYAQGVHAIVLLLHQGGQQNAPFSQGFMDVNKCENFTGPDLLDVVNRLDHRVDLVLSAHTHQPYVCNIGGRLVTSAASFGRVITEVNLKLKRSAGSVESVTAVNHVVTHDVAPDPRMTELIAHYKQYSDPLANRVVGTITGDLIAGRNGGANAAGESTLGDVISDAQLEATAPSDFGGAVISFMNPGGIRNQLLVDGQSSAGEGPGEVTYGELFAVQPFANTLTVKTMTGDMIYRVLEQQFDNPAAGSKRILEVSKGFTYTYAQNAPAGQHVVDGSVKLNGVPIDRNASYRVQMNSFLATGGDGFSVFNEGTDQLGGAVDLDALVDYFVAHTPIDPPTLDRIICTDCS
jgi:5'-nucleotidase